MACKQQKLISQSFAVHQYLRYGTTMDKFWWKYYSSLQMGYLLIASSHGRKGLREFSDVFLTEAPILLSWIKPSGTNHFSRVFPSDTIGIYIFTCEICGGGHTFLPFSPKYFCWYNLVSFYFIALSWPLIRSSVCIKMFDYLSSCELLSWEPKA